MSEENTTEISIDVKTYISKRLEDQIKWLGKKSGENKKYYIRLRFSEIVLAVSLPFLSGFANGGNTIFLWIIGGVGVLIAPYSHYEILLS